MIKDAIRKLEEALHVNSTRHATLQCLGNTHTSPAFLVPNKDEAKVYFGKATHYFEQAIPENPGDEWCVKSLEVAVKASEVHAEITSLERDNRLQLLGLHLLLRTCLSFVPQFLSFDRHREMIKASRRNHNADHVSFI